MTENTRELLLECKKAGYTRVALFVKDKRVPLSMSQKNTERWGSGSPKFPFKVVSCFPAGIRMDGKEIQGCTVSKHTDPPYTCPAIKAIIKKLQFNPGGSVYEDSHDITPCLVPTFDAGYYDLAELN